MIVESAEQAWEVLEQGDAYLVTPREIAVQAVVLGALVGGVVGYVAYKRGQKDMETKYEEILDTEIARAKAFYSKVNKEGMETPEKAREVLHPEEEDSIRDAAHAVQRYQGSKEPDVAEEIERAMTESDDDPGVTVIMEDYSDIDEDWDYERETEWREANPDIPYVVHLDEFMENEFDHDQVTLTYYSGDEVLADEKDEPIPYPDPIVGLVNLKRFGDGSGDPNVVLVRNDRLSMDYEVTLSSGKFAYEVLGLEHSDGGARAAQRRKELRKFRDGRE